LIAECVFDHDISSESQIAWNEYKEDCESKELPLMEEHIMKAFNFKSK